MNPAGHPKNLVSSHPGNAQALKSGAFSRTDRLSPRASEIAKGVMASGLVADVDWIGAQELARMLALAEMLDADIDRRGALTRSGVPRAVVEIRMRLTTKIGAWLAAYGATPASRAQLVQDLAAGGLAAAMARRREQLNGGET
jgi:hypothetical protein